MISGDDAWLSKCQPENLPVPPFDRYIYMLPEHVVKKPLRSSELGYEGYEPRFATVAQRDNNELHALGLVREYTNIPVPKLIYQGKGFNVFERIPGLTIFEAGVWEQISPRQKEGIKLQVQGFIKGLAKVPNGSGGIRSLTSSGELFHDQLPCCGPFESTEAFLRAYEDQELPLVHQINPLSKPVLSHMD